MTLLRRKDAMAFTTVVAAPEGASLGERYATIATAAALGERVRDQGGHALVVIDDLACMVGSPLQGAHHKHEKVRGGRTAKRDRNRLVWHTRLATTWGMA